NYPRTPNVT
ncbi:Dihydrolipoyl dehydrogenase, partial [Haemophilus influenzae]